MSNHDKCTLEGLIPGEGNESARFFFVGEAGGAEELAQGRPFVGRSGQRLMSILDKELGLKREDVFLSNIVQHRPPDNRNPKADEARACAPNLISEIERVDPEVIITLGNVPLNFFCKGSKVTKERGRGRYVEIAGKPRLLIPWLHPSFTLRSTTALQLALEDASNFYSEVEKKPAPAKRYERGVHIECAPLFAFDLETTSPRKGKSFATDEAEIVGWSASSEPYTATYHKGNIPPWLFVVEGLTDPNIKVICHNTKFEYKVLWNDAGISLTNFEDTKGMAYVLGYPDTSLKALARDVLGELPIKYSDLKIPRDIEKEALADLHYENFEYGAADSDNTLRLYYALREELEREGVLHIYEDIERPLIPVLARMETFGVAVNEARCKEILSEIDTEIERAEARCAEFLGDINVGSREQLSEGLEKLGAPITKRTQSKGLLSTSEVDLNAIKEWNEPLITALLTRQKFIKRRAFVESFLTLRGPDGKIHPSFNQFGHTEEFSDTGKNAPATGRLSSSGPNVQQVPNHEDEYWGPRIRSCLEGGEGRCILSVDFAQQEARVVAAVSEDRALLSDFADGVDIYAVVASDLYGFPVNKADHPHERFTGKTFFLAWAYGAGWRKVMDIDPGINRDSAKRGVARLAKRYPNVAAYARRMREAAAEHGYVETLFGRKRWLPEIYSNSRKDRAGAERKAANTPIQGTCADALKIILPRVEARLPEGADLMMTVHDELDISIVRDPSLIQNVIDIVREEAAGVLPNITLPVEFSLGDNWGNLEPYGEG